MYMLYKPNKKPPTINQGLKQQNGAYQQNRTANYSFAGCILTFSMVGHKFGGENGIRTHGPESL